MSLWERWVDNSEQQIDQEEGSDEDHRQEQNKCNVIIRLLVHDHDVRPAFQRHTLEHNQERVHNIIAISDTECWVVVLFAAEITIRAWVMATAEVKAAFPV